MRWMIVAIVAIVMTISVISMDPRFGRDTEPVGRVETGAR